MASLPSTLLLMYRTCPYRRRSIQAPGLLLALRRSLVKRPFMSRAATELCPASMAAQLRVPLSGTGRERDAPMRGTGLRGAKSEEKEHAGCSS